MNMQTQQPGMKAKPDIGKSVSTFFINMKDSPFLNRKITDKSRLFVIEASPGTMKIERSEPTKAVLIAPVGINVGEDLRELASGLEIGWGSYESGKYNSNVVGGVLSGLWAAAGSIKGATISGVGGTYVRRTVDGLMMGISNIVGTAVNGVMIGAGNRTKKLMGMAAGAVNVADEIIGAAMSIILTHVNELVRGLVVSGFWSGLYGDVDGVAVTGIGTMVEGKVRGIIVTGVATSIHKEPRRRSGEVGVDGAVVSGVGTYIEGDVKGAAMSGLVTYISKTLHGFGMGLVNYAEAVVGLRIGLVNIVKELTPAWSVDLGLVNINLHEKSLLKRYTPILSVRWKGKKVEAGGNADDLARAA